VGFPQKGTVTTGGESMKAERMNKNTKIRELI